MSRPLPSILAVVAALAFGCATAPSTQPDEAVYCPKCETVWIETTDFSDPYGLSTVKARDTRCPDCESAVATFFRTGKLRHECTTCGGDLVHCPAH